MDAPLSFINNLDTHKHILLLYTDPEYAKRIEFQFIENGLAKGEHCTYATQEDPDFIQKRMEEYGIDAQVNFLKKGFYTFANLQTRLVTQREYLRVQKNPSRLS